jgi:cytochrome c
MILARSSHARPSLSATLLALSVLGLAMAGSAEAQSDTQALQTLMQRNNCTACHLIDKRKYGPHFKEVAVRYAGDAKVIETLAAKIKAGGSGVWGEEPMPPQASVSDADARTMAELILALKP